MKKADLHVHSTFSDGTLTPTEIVKLAQKIELDAFALTDHDTVDGVPEAVFAGNKYGIEVIPGIEISTSYKGKEIHIVGLFIDYENVEFKEALGSEIQRRQKRNITLIEKFNEAGFPVTLKELENLFPESVITRAHFASYMVKRGYVRTNKEAFDKYLGDGCPLYVPREKKDVREAISLIRSAGGAPVLAHPLLYHLTTGELKKLCKELKEAGLIGIESMYSTYKGFDEINVRKIAHEFDLLESGGSDFHGANKPHISLGSGMGNLMINYDYLSRLKESVNQNKPMPYNL